MIFRSLILVGLLSSMMAATGAFLFEDLQVIDVRLVGMSDPTDSDRITVLWVEVTNPGPETLVPNFAVPGGALRNWYGWTIEEGPIALAPGERATYRVGQPTYTGVPVTEGFRVLVNDAHHGRIRGSTGVVIPDLDRRPPAILNPGFADWVPSMFHPGDLPYAWVPWVELHKQDGYRIDGQDGRVRLDLYPDQNRTTGDEWTLVSLRQRIDFPQTLRIEFVEGDRGAHSAGARTEVGVLLEDVHGGTQVVVLFADPATDSDQPARVNLTFGDFRAHRILATNRTVELDMLALYEEMGWHVPAKRTMPRLLPHGPQDVGLGAAAVEGAAERMEIVRPMEFKLFIASYPPHEQDHVWATFAFAGGPAWDPAPSRV